MVVGFRFGFFQKILSVVGGIVFGLWSSVFTTRAIYGGNGFVAQGYGDLWDNATVNLLTDNR